MSDRRLRSRFTTPPRDLIPPEDQTSGQLTTPMRSAIFAVMYYCEQKKIPCSLRDLTEVFGYASSTSAGVLKSNRCRRLQHSDTPDPRGRKKSSTNEHEIAAGTQIDGQSHLSDDENLQSQSTTAGSPGIPSIATAHSLAPQTKPNSLTPQKPGGKSRVTKSSGGKKLKAYIIPPGHQLFVGPIASSGPPWGGARNNSVVQTSSEREVPEICSNPENTISSVGEPRLGNVGDLVPNETGGRPIPRQGEDPISEIGPH